MSAPASEIMPEQWIKWICASKTDEEVRSKYEQWALAYDSDVSQAYGSVPHEVARVLSDYVEDKESTILDVGAGTGLVGVALASCGFKNLIAQDISPAMLTKAEAKGVYQSTVCSAIGKGSFNDLEPTSALVAAGVFSEGQAGPQELRALKDRVQVPGIVVFTARQSFLGQLEGVLAELGWEQLVCQAMPVYEDPMHVCAYRVEDSSRASLSDPISKTGGYSGLPFVEKNPQNGSVKADAPNDQLEKLEAVNRSLEGNTQISRDKLMEMGLIRECHEPVYKLGCTDPMPFYRLYLPTAAVGMFHPHREVSDEHKAIIIFLPGCGTSFSVANTLIDIAVKFHGRKGKNRNADHRQKKDEEKEQYTLPGEDAFRAASFAMDLPLNGMGADAPEVFFSERGLMAVIRHAHLVLSRLYPGRPLFVAGRSQGGIAGVLYAQWYRDVAGVIAVNPPHPDPELFDFTVEYLESKASVLADLLHAPGVLLHEPSWQAYKKFTPSFAYPQRPTLAPTMILVSLGDPFNKFPKYAEMLEKFGAGSGKRQVHVIDAGHNLWDRRSDIYNKVLSLQTEFMLAHMGQP